MLRSSTESGASWMAGGVTDELADYGSASLHRFLPKPGVDQSLCARIEASGQSIDLAFQPRQALRAPRNFPETADVAKPGCLAHPIKFSLCSSKRF
jgi:hypothetical protein